LARLLKEKAYIFVLLNYFQIKNIMEQVSFLLSFSFIIVTLLTVYQFYRASNFSKPFLIIATIWLAMQAAIGATDFYTNGFTKPPRFVLMVLPTVALMLFMFFSSKGKAFIENLDLQKLLLLHTIRIPVEMILYYLYVAKTIPQIMTFEGRNFDILAGITAPIVFYLQQKSKENKRLLLGWNVVALVLVLNITVIAIFSAQTPFQQFGFDQPNIAITHFPFNWLPSFLVPLVLFSHLVAIRRAW
jgi:hypothetical protein